ALSIGPGVGHVLGRGADGADRRRHGADALGDGRARRALADLVSRRSAGVREGGAGAVGQALADRLDAGSRRRDEDRRRRARPLRARGGRVPLARRAPGGGVARSERRAGDRATHPRAAHGRAGRTRRDIYTQQQGEKPRGYARAVAVGDSVWVSGCTSMNAAGQPEGLGDWAAQSDLSHETIRWALEQAGASLEDVVRRRIFTVDGAQVNRPHGQGPAWFAKSCPASLGCRVAGLARSELLIEV